MKKAMQLLFLNIFAVLVLTACSSAASSAGTTAGMKTETKAGTTAGMKTETKAGTTAGMQAETAAGAMTETKNKKGYRVIKADEAKKMIDSGKVTLVDVRRADEYAAGHIPGAINIPNESIAAEKPARLPDTEAVILIYCRTGIRAADASEKLVKIGYQNIYDMGGIVDWTFETVRGGE